MSIQNLGTFRENGRLRGTYVYMLLCRDDGPIYVKVGISDNPYKRLLMLRGGCPVTPRRFLSFEVRSRKKALQVESAIHAALDRWLAHGEWFKVNKAEKPEFNLALATAIAPHKETGWPCEWGHTLVAPLMEDARSRMNYKRQQLNHRSTAQKDFDQALRLDG